jgi:hypothetical protein
MQFTIKAVGTKPLLLHNVDLANPRNEWARKMSDLRGVPSRRRTDDWLDEMEFVSFMGAFYEFPRSMASASRLRTSASPLSPRRR